jgi:hypothetical protein
MAFGHVWHISFDSAWDVADDHFASVVCEGRAQQIYRRVVVKLQDYLRDPRVVAV